MDFVGHFKIKDYGFYIHKIHNPSGPTDIILLVTSTFGFKTTVETGLILVPKNWRYAEKERFV